MTETDCIIIGGLYFHGEKSPSKRGKVVLLVVVSVVVVGGGGGHDSKSSPF